MDNRGRKRMKQYMHLEYDTEQDAIDAIIKNEENPENKNIISKRIKNDGKNGTPKKDGSNSRIIYIIKNKYMRKNKLTED